MQGLPVGGACVLSGDILPHVQAFIMYDPLALLACCSRTLATFFDPEIKTVKTDRAFIRASLQLSGAGGGQDGSSSSSNESSNSNGSNKGSSNNNGSILMAIPERQEHMVVGVHGVNDGIRNVQAVRTFLMNAARHSLSSTLRHTVEFRTASFKGHGQSAIESAQRQIA